LFGAFKFVAEANKQKVKPIVGCEFYLVADRFQKQFTKEQKDIRFHQLLLAKNREGYKNLSKLCSLGFIDGMYSKWPRIDKELLLKYKDNLIATTCCLGAEVPQTILNKGATEAEKTFLWWLDLFGEDYYVEMQRHSLPEQEIVNDVLLGFAQKYNVKIIASNDSHYVNEEDAPAHDILLCVNTGELRSTPIYNGEEKKKHERFGFPNNQFFFKTTAEMTALFSDLPQAIDNTNEIVDKIEPFKLERDILLPVYPLPPLFDSNDAYLAHLTLEGARKRYKEISAVVEERIQFELSVIKTMGFAGYFLIVQDFINAGRDLGVLVGPGRGSAAGSVVAYCIGITNIDPIKYELLFERFLNPERPSPPDIDMDFADNRRDEMIAYAKQK
jgi:DNA polymerase-3 subunit alpha